jgi:Tol biopolymer transport system component
MTLAAGTRLGPYEILAPLGAGGMGEVYKARDSRLERTVAVKVLPSHLSSSPEVRQRFEREAKTISQLSHPHICALYDVGSHEGTEYLVMEYLEGETLSERLAKGPLPLEQTIRCGIEIADALGKAHRQGIVHRDLKPGNVMLTKSGVKLLDFGLAKATAPPDRQAGYTSLPTMAGGQNLTEKGTILGTFQYMAPEQLEGKEADARTDIFAFGCVLYEMATGKKAFSGASQASLISAIMSAEPSPISSLQPASPQALDRVVRICVAKDPDARWQSAQDIGAELRWIAEGSAAGVAAPAVIATRRKSRERIAWSAFALAAVAAAGFAVAFLRRPPAPVRALRFEIAPTEIAPYQAPGPDADMTPSLSPDGRVLVFSARDSQNHTSLWSRPLDSLAARTIPGTEGAQYPFWSPDGASIGFFAGGKLKRVEASGGAVQILCEAQDGRGGTWNRDGVIVFAAAPFGPLARVAAGGGAPSPVLPLDSAHGEDSQRWPSFLPDGKHFLYFSYLGADPESRDQNGGVRVGSLDSKETRPLVPRASNAVFAPPGHILFYRDGNLLAQPLDPKSLATRGDPIPIADKVAFLDGRKLALFSASASGVLAYVKATVFPSRLLWFDRQGRQLGSVGEQGGYVTPRLSPDGRRLAVAVQDAQTEVLWICDLARGSRTRFSSEGNTEDSNAVWSPDGARLAFSSGRGGPSRLFVRSAGGEGSERSLLKTANAEVPFDWSRDGRLIAYMAPGTGTGWDIWTVSAEGEGKAVLFAGTKADETEPAFSPDGKWIAFTSSDSGKSDVCVAPFPGPGSRIVVSTSGGRDPRWRADGKELFYIAEDGKLMSVPIKGGATFEAGLPAPLFETRTRAQGGLRYDASSDGQRFLVVTRVQEREVPPIAIHVNWALGLKK